jgi:hypothetical protein
MPVITLRDNFLNGTPGAINLSGWTPSHPGASGWTAWQYTGSASDVVVEEWDAVRRVGSGGGAIASPCRLNIDFVDDHFEMVVDVARLATDTASGAGVCFWVKNTTIGSFTNTEYYKVQLERTAADQAVATLYHVTSAGSVVAKTSSPAFTMWYSGGGSPTGKRLRVTVHGTECKAYVSTYGTGASESLGFTATLEYDYRGSDHLRHGIIQSGLSSGQFVIGEFILTDLVGTDAGVTDPSTLADLVSTGLVGYVERDDGEIEEWVVANYEDDVDRNRTTITLLPVAAWFAERVQVRSDDSLTVEYDGALDVVLAQLLATGDWPAFVIAGTTEVNPRITGTWNQANGTAALQEMVAAANAAPEIVLARQVVRYEYRRVSSSQWAIDFLVSAAAGTPVLAEGKQVTRGFKRKVDRTREAQVVYPANSESTSIARAYLRVALVESDILLTLTDWSTGPDDILVVEDDQWVGHYLIAPDGTAYLITDSFAATGKIECASLTAGDLNAGDLVRFAVASDGTAALAVRLPNRQNPKQANVTVPFPSATNWAYNSQMRTLDPTTAEPDLWVASDGAEDDLTVETGATFVETGSQSLKWEPAGAGEHVTMDPITVPHALWTSKEIHYGVRYYATNPTAVTIQHFIVGGGAGSGTWDESTSVVTEGNWHTRSAVLASWIGFLNTGFRIRLRSTNNIPVYIDRVWIFFAGEETDDRVEGSGPLRGLYYGNFELEQRETGGLSYEVPIVDMHRRNPTLYPDDKLRVHQQAQLVYPTRGVDTELPVASLDVNELRAEDVKIVLGAIRQRLTDRV